MLSFEENNRKQGGCLLFPDLKEEGVMRMSLYEVLCLLIRAGELLLALLTYFFTRKH